MALFDHALFNEDRLIGEVMIPIQTYENWFFWLKVEAMPEIIIP